MPKPEQKASDLGTSLIVECPILSRETADRLASDLIASEHGWREWKSDPPLCPRFERWVIVGRDCLGYVHNATHLIDQRDGSAFDWWKRVQI